MRFKTRIFKYEIGLNSDALTANGDDFWRFIFEGIAKRGFTGICFYSGGHPFEHLLDMQKFPEAAADPLAERIKRQKAFNRILELAHEYGLQTFIQHYVQHFPRVLAKAAGLDIREGGYARLAGYDLPIINKYIHYCYREIFKQCPDLDGLYFNFESVGSACEHVLATAVYECNRMKTKPIFVFRLWGMRDFKGMKAIVRAYKGRCIFGHKVAERADVYHMPVADSRVLEWKKAVPGVEMMHIAGPCHNCATNLSGQLWADYDFVQELLADCRKKGSDSLAFHIQTDILGARYRTFDREKTTYGLYNILHLEAATDYFQGIVKTPAQRHAFMADWLQVPAAAGRAAYEAITAASKSVPLAEQQFLVTSAFEGYWLPPRSSLIQNPFILMPVDQLRRSTELAQFGSWVEKTKEFPCGKANETQYIIDYVNPDKRTATRNPSILAREIKTACARALKWGREYRRLAGKDKGDHLMHYLEINNAIGMWAYHNIIAGINFYSVYYAGTRAAILSGLEKGIAALKEAQKLERDPIHLRNIIRVFFFYSRHDLAAELKAAQRALRLARKARIPMDAFRKFMASRCEYNEIMRTFRAGADHRDRERQRAARQLEKAAKLASGSLQLLLPEKAPRLIKAVEAWQSFIDEEKDSLTPPAMEIRKGSSGTAFIPLSHEQCFRWGEFYGNDFAEFFAPGDYHHNTDHLSFKVGYDASGLIVTLREEQMDMKQREAQWESFRGTGDDRGFLRVFLAPDTKALKRRQPEALLDFAITPKGQDAFLTHGRANTVPVTLESRFLLQKDAWETEVRIPYKLLGAKPQKGAVWGFNVLSNTAIVMNHQNSWARMYENMRARPSVLGRIKFVT